MGDLVNGWMEARSPMPYSRGIRTVRIRWEKNYFIDDLIDTNWRALWVFTEHLHPEVSQDKLGYVGPRNYHPSFSVQRQQDTAFM